MGEFAKLHYFKGRGRAETTRWMLAANQIEFENAPLATPEDFDTLKKSEKLPFNQLPLLEIDGLNLSQSAAMVGYLARRGGFYGNDANEAVRCEMIAGAVADFNPPAMQFAFQPDPEIAKQGVPSENPIRRRNSRVWPNRGKVGACVMPYDFCP